MQNTPAAMSLPPEKSLNELELDSGVAAADVGTATVGAAADVEVLAVMGYKQELVRKYSTVQVFAIAFSIMGLVPSIASSLTYSLPAGPAGMVWVCCEKRFVLEHRRHSLTGQL